MTEREKEDQFDTSYSTSITTIDSASEQGPQDQLVVEVTDGGQLSELDITGSDQQNWEVDRRDTDSANPETVRDWVTTDIDRGDFEDPVLEIGAGREVAVRNATTLTSGNSYAVNVRVDEYSS